jgi:hypothetical protein
MTEPMLILPEDLLQGTIAIFSMRAIILGNCDWLIEAGNVLIGLPQNAFVSKKFLNSGRHCICCRL